MGPKSISGSSPIPNRERISCARASASNAHFPARVGNSSSLSVLPGRSVDELRQAEKKSAWLTIGRYRGPRQDAGRRRRYRSEEHTSELQSLMRISYAVFCLKKKNT